MDGGTKDNLPVQVLKDMGAEKTLGISFKLDKYESNGNILATILRACDIFSLKDVRKAQEIADYFVEIEVGNAKLLEIKEKFGFLVEAFKYGAPPHGGLAYGLDRMVMLLAGESSIREVKAFPKNQAAQCMVSEAPGAVTDEQLAELGLKRGSAK